MDDFVLTLAALIVLSPAVIKLAETIGVHIEKKKIWKGKL